jgi:hypothetical protein
MRRGLLCLFLSIGALSVLLLPVQAREGMVHFATVAEPHIGSARTMRPDMDRRPGHHRHFVGFLPFGFLGEYVEYPSPEAIGPAPPAIASASPPPAVPDVDRPPCHEVSGGGVVIERGLGCRRR